MLEKTLTENLAIFIGLFWTITGLGILLNKEWYRSMFLNLAQYNGLFFLGGFVIFILGTFLVNIHFLWGSALEIYISLVAVLSLIKGSVLLLAPTVFEPVSLKLASNSKNFRGWGAVLCLTGLLTLAAGLARGY